MKGKEVISGVVGAAFFAVGYLGLSVALLPAVAMGAGATALGTVGLAAGISSGEFKNVLGYTMAGGTTGAVLGKALGDRAMDGMATVKEDFKEGYLGKAEYDNRQLDREYFNGKGFQEMLDNHSLMPEMGGLEREKALKKEIATFVYLDNLPILLLYKRKKMS